MAADPQPVRVADDVLYDLVVALTSLFGNHPDLVPLIEELTAILKK